MGTYNMPDDQCKLALQTACMIVLKTASGLHATYRHVRHGRQSLSLQTTFSLHCKAEGTRETSHNLLLTDKNSIVGIFIM